MSVLFIFNSSVTNKSHSEYFPQSENWTDRKHQALNDVFRNHRGQQLASQNAGGNNRPFIHLVVVFFKLFTVFFPLIRHSGIWIHFISSEQKEKVCVSTRQCFQWLTENSGFSWNDVVAHQRKPAVSTLKEVFGNKGLTEIFPLSSWMLVLVLFY